MRFFFLGERLAVDLLNTVVVQDGRVHLLQGPMDVAAWEEAAGGLAPGALRGRAAGPEPGRPRGVGAGGRVAVRCGPHADMRGSGPIPRLLSAAPGGRPSWYREPVDSRRSTATQYGIRLTQAAPPG